MIERTVTEDQAGQRLDKFLLRLFEEVPKSHVYRLLRLRRVRLNGQRAHGETILTAGDRLVVRGDEQKLLAPRPAHAFATETALQIIYEDGDLLVVDKPAGLAVHPGSGIEGKTLVDLARAHEGPKEAGVFRASPAHRLDRDTSGVVVIAKTRRAMVRLTELFTEGSPDKRYLALIKGRVADAGTIDLPLVEHEQTSKSRRLNGVKLQEATTHWTVVAQTADVALVSCRIETGRTHQIRRHFAAIGHPVVGDKRHGDFTFNREIGARCGLKRMFLHAEALKLRHPSTGEPVQFDAALPPELREALANLGLPTP